MHSAETEMKIILNKYRNGKDNSDNILGKGMVSEKGYNGTTFLGSLIKSSNKFFMRMSNKISINSTQI